MNQSQSSLAGTSKQQQQQQQQQPGYHAPPPGRSSDGYNQSTAESDGKNDEMAKLTALNNSYQDYQGKATMFIKDLEAFHRRGFHFRGFHSRGIDPTGIDFKGH